MAQNSQASQEIFNSKDYFRIFQDIGSSGDIFELNVSAKAMFIGPQSDVQRVDVTYYDPRAPDGSNLRTVEVSVDNPFVGRLDALMGTPVPNTGPPVTPGVVATQSPARMLVSLKDLIEDDYVPYDLNNDPLIIRVPPQIDFYQYFKEPSNLAPVRADKTFLFSTTFLPVTENDLAFIVPYYGRRFARIVMVNQTGTDTPFSFEVRGVRLAIGKTTPAGTNKSAEVPLGYRILAANGMATLETRASEDGSFDLLVIRLITDQFFLDARNLRIDVSDREA
jgi:hypothetical protein